MNEEKVKLAAKDIFPFDRLPAPNSDSCSIPITSPAQIQIKDM